MLSHFRERLISPRYQYILVGFLLIATPFLLFPSGYKLLALLLLPAIWVIRWIAVGRVTPRTPLDWPILLILIMVLVSIWATFDLNVSIGKIAGLLLGIVVYYAVADLAGTKRSLRTVVAFFILAGVGLALLSALGTQWIYKSPLIAPIVDKIPRVFQGLPGAESGFHPNQVAGVLIFFVPLQVVLLSYRVKRLLPWSQRAFNSDSPSQESNRDEVPDAFAVALLGLSLLATAGVLILTQGRGAIGGLLVGLVAIAAMRTHWGKVLAVTGVIALLVAARAGAFDDLVTSGLETEAVGTLSLASRVELWSRGLQGLADFPFTGMGMNAFRHVMPVLYPAFSVSPTWNFGHAHNHLLQTGLDLGVPGLVAYVSLWLGAGFLLGQTVSGSRSPFYRSVALGLIGGFIAYFTYGITDAVALGAKPGFVFWWALGLVVATHRLFYRDGVTP